jgi:hypothetical protein
MINCPPIWYVPIELDESAKLQELSIQKITFPDSSQFAVQVWTGTVTDKQLLLHKIEARNACGRKGQFYEYLASDSKESVAVKMLNNFCMVDPTNLEASAALDIKLDINKAVKIHALSAKKKLETAESIFALYASLL